MPDINITVAHKVAVSDTQAIVCDNSDHTVNWTLDEEWSAYDTKTMRTIYLDGTYTDKVFSGDVTALPVCTVPGAVQIGLFAGDIRTSRVAILRALPSVRSAAGAPADPTPDVYDQLMDLIKGLGGADPEAIKTAVAEYLAAHPIKETDPTVPAWAKAETKPTYSAAEVGAIAQSDLQAATDAALAQAKSSGEFDGATGPAGPQGPAGATGKDGAGMDVTGAAVGQISKIAAVDASGVPTAWSPVDMPSGGDGDGGAKEFRLIRSITLDEQSDRVDISEDSSGNAFALHEVYVMLAAQSYEDANDEVNFLPNGRWGSKDAYIISANRASKSSETWKNKMTFHAVYADGIICSEQLPTKGQNNNLTASFSAGQSIITGISIASKFAAGCTFFVIGR